MAGRRNRVRTSLAVMAAAAALMVAAAVYLGSIVRQYSSLRAEKAALEQQLADAELRTQQLEQQLEYTFSLDFIERAAREKLGWILPGEIRIVTGEEEIASADRHDAE